jgi:GNAT superfamily N-acetyltransferase
MTSAFTIRRALPAHAGTVTALLATGFMPDPVSCWLYDNKFDRERWHPGFFRVFVDYLIEYGRIDIVGDFAGAALWLDVTRGTPVPQRPSLEAACGPAYQRWQQLDTLMDQRHPWDCTHAYLAFLCVDAPYRGQGLGRMLVAHRLRELAMSAVPAYLEDSNSRLNEKFYQGLGFTPFAPPIWLPNGPPLYPLIRETRTLHAGQN